MGRHLQKLLLIVILSCAAHVFPAEADPLDLIDDAFVEKLRTRFSTPLVRQMIAWQNRQTQGLSAAVIGDVDRRWVKERDSDDKGLIVAILSNPLSIYLLQIQAASRGLYSEIFIMDAKGLNVGQSTVTSDYWQGDEAKFLKTYPASESGLFIDEPEVHEMTGETRVQVSFALHDEDGGARIGVATVEINLDALAQHQSSGS